MTSEEILNKIQARFPNAGKAGTEVKGYLTVKVEKEDLPSVVGWLKAELGFNYLDMISAVDYLGPVDPKGYILDPNPNAFLPEGAVPQVDVPAKSPNYPYRDVIEAVYCLSNLKEKQKVFLKVETARADARVPSLCSIFKAADWQEREAFDLLGLRFEGHPNLKKILTPEFIEGHPLRKDYVHKKDRFD